MVVMEITKVRFLRKFRAETIRFENRRNILLPLFMCQRGKTVTVLLNFKRTFWVPCDLFLHPYAGQSWLSPTGRVTDLTEQQLC